MHVLRSARVQTILAFAFGLAVTFIALSSAAHGAPLHTQHAVYFEPGASPAIASPALQLVAAPMPLSLQASTALPDAGPQVDAGAEPTPPSVPPAADIPDPEQNPGGFIDAALVFWRAGGKVPIVLVGLIGLLSVLKRRVDWLRVGWRATAVGVVGVLVATLLDTWFSSGAAGNIWSWLFGGIVGVVNFIANPRLNPAKSGDVN